MERGSRRYYNSKSDRNGWRRFGVTESVGFPQNSGFKLGGPAFSESQKKILSSAFNAVNESDCKKFINETLAKNKVDEAVDSLDKLLNRATFGYYDVNADYTNNDLGSWLYQQIQLAQHTYSLVALHEAIHLSGGVNADILSCAGSNPVARSKYSPRAERCIHDKAHYFQAE
jgi:hypothetical protein